MNFRFFSGGAWDVRNTTPPWGDRPSIYQHILSHIRAGEPGLGAKGNVLPDEKIVRGGKQIGWAPGALDGVMGHHAAKNEAIEIANRILESFRALTKKATDERARSLYSLLLDHPTLSYVDQLLEAVVTHGDLDVERVHAIAQWLATNAADREPIKCAIAFLGVCRGGDDRDLLLTLGRHEEFTLFVSVALGNLGDDPELSRYALACLVTGWGRIQIIERLANTKDEQIKSWLLREGYQNDVLHEYTALICAKTGDLLTALRQPEPDEKLLEGAGAILTALIRGVGGPVEGMDAYDDGAEATELYLSHLQTRSVDLQGLIDVSTIDEFVKKESPSDWQERRAKLLELSNAILSRPGWEEKIRSELVSEDQQTFWNATEAARLLGVDVWDIHFERLQRGEDCWFSVMQTDDPDRIERVITFAEETLPLNEIASGPSESLGLGPEFKHHSALDSVLQELRRFPGKGWPLIQAGLQSPTVRNRNMAVEALKTWDRPYWHPEAEPLLRRAIQSEPSNQIRATMMKVLNILEIAP
jgi:hypothetical protein